LLSESLSSFFSIIVGGSEFILTTLGNGEIDTRFSLYCGVSFFSVYGSGSFATVAVVVVFSTSSVSRLELDSL
jgi:hypothetical protein